MVPHLQVVVAASAGSQLRVMIAGAPAAGKGTQCAKIVEKVRHTQVGSQAYGQQQMHEESLNSLLPHVV
jgi:adenylate kinase family enzyme